MLLPGILVRRLNLQRSPGQEDSIVQILKIEKNPCLESKLLVQICGETSDHKVKYSGDLNSRHSIIGTIKKLDKMTIQKLNGIMT
jgi:hypothetical protein